MARQTKDLTEVGAHTKILERNSDGSLLVQIITPGWGSSGYYSAEVLEAAAKDKVWPAGTHMYFDHPSASEAADRPERSVKDLAATLTEDARWDGKRMLARVNPVGLGKTVLADEAFRKAIGASVRASAEMEIGEAEGRSGWIVEKIHPGTHNSVDFVTHAGRGGMILESARQSVPAAELESDHATVWEASANDTERALQDTVSAAYADHENDTFAWMRDYDPDAKVAYFEVSVGGKTSTWQQTYAIADNGEATLQGEKTEVQIRTQYVPVKPAEESAKTNVPVHPAGQSTNTQEHNMPEKIEEGAKVTILETKLRTLEADAGRVPLLESERDTARTERDEARKDLAVEKAKNYARDFGATRVKEANSELEADVVEMIVTKAMSEALPIGEDGLLDTDAFGKRVDTARTAEETYLAKVAAKRGGDVRGLGPVSEKQDITRKDTMPAIAEAFGRQVKEA